MPCANAEFALFILKNPPLVAFFKERAVKSQQGSSSRSELLFTLARLRSGAAVLGLRRICGRLRSRNTR